MYDEHELLIDKRGFFLSENPLPQTLPYFEEDLVFKTFRETKIMRPCQMNWMHILWIILYVLMF